MNLNRLAQQSLQNPSNHRMHFSPPLISESPCILIAFDSLLVAVEEIFFLFHCFIFHGILLLLDLGEVHFVEIADDLIVGQLHILGHTEYFLLIGFVFGNSS